MLVRAARILDMVTESEVIFCLNGSREATADFLEAQAAALHHADLPFRCIESLPGKIAAQRAIAKERRLSGHLLFVDADVSFEPPLFRSLYEALLATHSAHVAYAEVEALPSSAAGALRWLQDAYYPNRHQLPRRRHLHGRCFLLRDWLPDFDWDANRAPPKSPDLAYLALDRGPLVDDIHYSRVLVHRFGAPAILPAPNAVVRFQPPDSWAELYRDSFRTEFELVRLSHLFPESEPVEREVFSQQSPIIRCLCALFRAGPGTAAYLTIETFMRMRARHRILHQRACPKSWKVAGQNHHA